jgi:hypothetical protein
MYVIGIEIDGVNHKVNVFDGENPLEAIKLFCIDKSKDYKL